MSSWRLLVRWQRGHLLQAHNRTLRFIELQFYTLRSQSPLLIGNRGDGAIVTEGALQLGLRTDMAVIKEGSAKTLGAR